MATGESKYPRSGLISPELAGAGGILIVGAVVAALLVHYQSSPSGAGLPGDYRVTPTAASQAAATPAAQAAGWTTDGPFAVRVDALSCAAATAAAPLTCTVRAEVRATGGAAPRYLPPVLLAAPGSGTLTPVGGDGSGEPAGSSEPGVPGGVEVAPGRTVHLVYRFRAAAGAVPGPPLRLLLGNGAPADALTVRRR